MPQILLAVLQAIVALPKIGELIKQAMTTFVIWEQKQRTLAQRKRIEHAALASKMAKTREAKREALKAWKRALD